MIWRAARPLLTVAGLTLVLIGLLLALLLGADGAWSARAVVPAGRAAVVLDPALVSVLGARVQVSATAADGARLFVGRARSDDAQGYTEGTDHARVSGLRADRTLVVTAVDGATGLVAPDAVDVWQQTSTDGSLAWEPTPGARSVVVARPDGHPLDRLRLTVVWRHGAWTWWPVGCLLLGAGLLATARYGPRLVTGARAAR